MHSKTNLVLLSCCLGIFGTVSQVVLLRELLIAFTGNELTIATVMALWLVAVSAGSLAAKSSRRTGSIDGSLATLFIIAGLLSVFQVILIRALRPVMAPTGELLGPGMMVLLAAVGVAPGAALMGALFVRLVRYGRESVRPSPVPSVYGGEAIGSGLAGAGLSFWLLEAADPLTTVSLGAAAAFIAALALSLGQRADGKALSRKYAGWSLACLVLVALVSLRGGFLDLALRGFEWRPLTVVESLDSKYGDIVVTDRDELHDFFENGALAFTLVDPMLAEETVHIPLLYHASPHNVLLIGSSGSGAVQEILKHPSVRRVDFVELDPALLELAVKYAPSGWLRGTGREVRGVIGDGRSYVNSTADKYDVIIVAVGRPLSLQVNRFYTEEFFRSARRVLSPAGLIGLTVESPGAYMGPESAGLVSSLANALRAEFAHVEMLPGETIHLMASDWPLSSRKSILTAVLKQRGVETSYVNEFNLWDRLSEFRAAQLDSVLALYDKGTANSDAKPVTFSFALAIWARHFASGKAVAWAVSHLDLGITAILLSAVAAAAVALYSRASGLGVRAAPALACLYTMGFTTMFSQVLIMLCFQITRGYVYTEMALLIAAFMAGAGLTATFAGRRLAAIRESISLIVLEACLVALPLAVIAVFNRLRLQDAALTGYAADAVYAALAFAGGVLGAAVFSAASASLMRRRAETVEAGALSYSIDLAGASIAGFTTGFLTIPALGITGAALAVSLVNFIALGIVQFAIGRPARPH
jgi:spermidine synthase